jgi:hypothetical protein
MLRRFLDATRRWHRHPPIEPVITGREFNQQLAAQNLAFPVGHCPTVPMSGFLLNGGLGWNFNGWGPACLSIEVANVVTAAADVVVADQAQHVDLLWGGPRRPDFLALSHSTFSNFFQCVVDHHEQLLLPVATHRSSQFARRGQSTLG